MKLTQTSEGAMADGEQLGDKQRKEIAKWFLLNSPAGEIQYVAKGPFLCAPSMLGREMLCCLLCICTRRDLYECRFV